MVRTLDRVLRTTKNPLWGGSFLESLASGLVRAWIDGKDCPRRASFEFEACFMRPSLEAGACFFRYGRSDHPR